MEKLNKLIKKLSEQEYQQLLTDIVGKKKDKPYLMLEATRNQNFDDSEMMNFLESNPSSYYTIKSRLNSKIASILSQEVYNPIGILAERVSKAQANLYGTNKPIAIKALLDLEKELLEYDLQDELITVYKTLARLHLYDENQYHLYQQKYDRHVAYSLSVSKAEDLFYEFIQQLGHYQLTRKPEDLEVLKRIRREIANIRELYESHRLFVLSNMMRIIYWYNTPYKLEKLKEKEIDTESILQEIEEILNDHPLDTFYQNITPLVDFMFFQYYQQIQNQVRADKYYKKIKPEVVELSQKHFMTFFIIQFLEGKVNRYLAKPSAERHVDKLIDLNEGLKNNFEVHKDEVYHYAGYQRFLAICKFYERNYRAAAKQINDLRNEFPSKQFIYFDIEIKLFQALQYVILGEDELYIQLLSSINRQITENTSLEKANWEKAKIFVKLLKAVSKTTDLRNKIKNISLVWEEFKEANENDEEQFLWFVQLDEHTIRTMANPLKEINQAF